MEKTTIKPTRNTTVAVSPEVGKKLERFCSMCGITKKDFISLSLDYFQRYGINPANHESPAKEMEKLIKKNDQVIAFIRKQEKDVLRPMVEAVAAIEARMKGEYATKADLRKFTDIVGQSYMTLLEGLRRK